jgi:hypothetical protein
VSVDGEGRQVRDSTVTRSGGSTSFSARSRVPSSQAVSVVASASRARGRVRRGRAERAMMCSR